MVACDDLMKKHIELRTRELVLSQRKAPSPPTRFASNACPLSLLDLRHDVLHGINEAPLADDRPLGSVLRSRPFSTYIYIYIHIHLFFPKSHIEERLQKNEGLRKHLNSTICRRSCEPSTPRMADPGFTGLCMCLLTSTVTTLARLSSALICGVS